MADQDTEDSDKQYEPTQKRLDEARKRGDIPMSQDLTTSGAYAGLILGALAVGVASLNGLGESLSWLLEHAGPVSQSIFAGPATAPVGQIMSQIAWNVLPWLLGPMLGVLLAVIAQQSFKVSPSKIVPKLSRISPLSNAKQKFGADGLFNFFKSFAKLLIFSLILATTIVSDLPDLMATLYGSAHGLIGLMFSLAIEFLTIVLAVSLSIGAIDFLWQRAQHIKKNRMSHKDLQDETKESEGDPHLKQKRRQKGIDIATNRMMSDVPDADVVIVNPTHYAVALKWDRGAGGAPVCVAKGVDDVALRIREVSQIAGVPIRRDPSTARALYATLDIGDQVLPEQYRPVAAAIRFADRVRKKAPVRR